MADKSEVGHVEGLLKQATSLERKSAEFEDRRRRSSASTDVTTEGGGSRRRRSSVQPDIHRRRSSYGSNSGGGSGHRRRSSNYGSTRRRFSCSAAEADADPDWRHPRPRNSKGDVTVPPAKQTNSDEAAQRKTPQVPLAGGRGEGSSSWATVLEEGEIESGLPNGSTGSEKRPEIERRVEEVKLVDNKRDEKRSETATQGSSKTIPSREVVQEVETAASRFAKNLSTSLTNMAKWVGGAAEVAKEKVSEVAEEARENIKDARDERHRREMEEETSKQSRQNSGTSERSQKASSTPPPVKVVEKVIVIEKEKPATNSTSSDPTHFISTGATVPVDVVAPPVTTAVPGDHAAAGPQGARNIGIVQRTFGFFGRG